MAGRGPAPKDPKRRARRNAEPAPSTIVRYEPADQPRLPAKMPSGEKWPARTRAWWKLWAESPLSDSFGATDWSELLDTATLHGAFWSGDLKVAAELRLRVAKFGATPEDRARLRIQFAAADEADSKRPSGPIDAQARYGKLRAV